MFGIYIHIPFCETICPYCDFCSLAPHEVSAEFVASYPKMLVRELELHFLLRPWLRSKLVDTIYFGGGTPSTLEARAYEPFIEALRNHFVFSRALEMTLEANPGTLSPDKLASFREIGVTRLSVGVQSFDDSMLKVLGRNHTSAQIREAIKMVRDADFFSWSLDLMFAAPEQSLELWRRELDEVVATDAPHVSIYNLTLHEGTPYHAANQKGLLRFPDEETQRSMFQEMRERLVAAEYEHYEISNFARAGHESRHNQNYWRGGDFLGLGLSAHSSLDEERFAVTESPQDYSRSLERGELPVTELPQSEGRARFGEAMML
ncbi:MAG: radical SAM family heme chaperone HemW, partial [bacterium]